MALRFDILHIGVTDRNTYWGEQNPQRTPIATMTLIEDDGTLIVVDPGLPAELIPTVLSQRAGKTPNDIDQVFVTSRRASHLRGLTAFPKARWLAFETELQAWANVSGGIPSLYAGRLTPAPERLTDNVHLYPTPGPTSGHCSLLITTAAANVLIAGDAVLTRDHYEHGAVWDRCEDVPSARASLTEVIELADIIVPGHDNIFHGRGFGQF